MNSNTFFYEDNFSHMLNFDSFEDQYQIPSFENKNSELFPLIKQASSFIPQQQESQNTTTTNNVNTNNKIDVILNYVTENNSEMVPNVPYQVDNNGQIIINSLIDGLSDYGFNFNGLMIFYYNIEKSLYVYCGKGPLTKIMTTQTSSCISQGEPNTLTLKLRSASLSHEGNNSSTEKSLSTTQFAPKANANNIFDMFNNNVSAESTQKTADNTNQFKKQQSEDVFNRQQSFLNKPSSTFEADLISVCTSGRRRNQERKVAEVLDLIKRWRDLYQGVEDQVTGEIKRMSLAEAAQELNVPKKSLDDYQMVIKSAKKYGFDFAKNQNMRFGLVREFVRKNKSSKANKNDIDADFFMTEESSDGPSTSPNGIGNGSKRIHKY